MKQKYVEPELKIIPFGMGVLMVSEGQDPWHDDIYGGDII